MPDHLIGLYGANARYYESALRHALEPHAEVKFLGSESELAEVRDDLTVLVSGVYSAPFGSPKRLRLLQATGAGLDRIDRSVLPPGCEVRSAPGHEIPMAEFIIYSMLRLLISGSMLEQSFGRGDRFGGAYGVGGLHGELFGRTVCFLGYGAVAQEAVLRAKAMGMRIGAVSRSRHNGHPIEWWLPSSEIREAARRSDVLVVTCPLTSETEGMVDDEVLAALGSGGFLINVSRAAVVDEAALYHALAGGRIAGAALDVWYEGPPTVGRPWAGSRFDFRSLPNVLGTPHASAWTTTLWERRTRFVVQSVESLIHDRPWSASGFRD